MPKPPRVDRPVNKNLSLPTSVIAAVELRLYSEVEQRVPHGMLSTLVTGLLKQWLAECQAKEGTQS